MISPSYLIVGAVLLSCAGRVCFIASMLFKVNCVFGIDINHIAIDSCENFKRHLGKEGYESDMARVHFLIENLEEWKSIPMKRNTNTVIFMFDSAFSVVLKNKLLNMLYNHRPHAVICTSSFGKMFGSTDGDPALIKEMSASFHQSTRKMTVWRWYDRDDIAYNCGIDARCSLTYNKEPANVIIQPTTWTRSLSRWIRMVIAKTMPERPVEMTTFDMSKTSHLLVAYLHAEKASNCNVLFVLHFFI